MLKNHPTLYLFSLLGFQDAPPPIIGPLPQAYIKAPIYLSKISVREQGTVREQSDPVIVLEQISVLSSGLSLGVGLKVCCWLNKTCLVRLIQFKVLEHLNFYFHVFF